MKELVWNFVENVAIFGAYVLIGALIVLSIYAAAKYAICIMKQ